MDKKHILFKSIMLIIEINYAAAKLTHKQYALMPTLFHFDDYDKCMLHEEEALYCRITLQLNPVDLNNVSKIWNIIRTISSDPNNYRHDILRHGVCVTDKLNTLTDKFQISQKLNKYYNNKYRQLGIRSEIINMQCESNDSLPPLDIYDVSFGIFVLSYITFVLFASFFEGFSRYRTKTKYDEVTTTPLGKFLSAFSIPKNWNRLKHVNLDNPDILALRCIQGIRFYNMIIVIIGHTIAMNLAIPVINPLYTETMQEKFVYKIFLGLGKYVIQTYFMISGWLLTYHFFMALEKEKVFKPIHLFWAVIHRYFRLTPTLAILIGLYSTWFERLARGPFWDQLVGQEYRLCRENWWTNLLYVNNYVNQKKMCFPQSWYLAVDTQFYIISLFLLWLMWNYQNKIFYILGGILSFHIIVLFFINYWSDWQPSTLFSPEVYYNRRIIELDQWHVTFASPYSNLPGLVAGLGFGYLFHQYRNHTLLTKNVHIVVWWIIIWTTAFGVMLLPELVPNRTRLFNAIYGSLNRSIFIFGIGLGIFGTTQGHGWIMKWICEWPPTYVLGRLTYSAYLVHILFQRLQAGMKRFNYLSDYNIFFESIGNVTVSYIGALILTLLIEMPISELQKRFVPKQNDNDVLSKNNNKNM